MDTMSKDNFSISVIIPTYNRCQYLEYTLKSLVSQSLEQSNFEVVIVDDGSSDSTFPMIKTFENTINLKYVYQADKGFRSGSARNLGIRVADGRICLFLDSGMIVKSDCLQQHLDLHQQKNNEVAIIGYVYGYSAKSEADFITPIYPNDADGSIAKLVEMGKVWDIRENIYRKYNDQLEDLAVPWTLFWSGHLSIRKKSLFDVGFFDENYDSNWGCEDNDLGYRLHQAKKEILLGRRAVALHLPHEIDLNLRIQQGSENCKYFHQKFPTPETQLFLDYYAQEISAQCVNNKVIDFHELITSNQHLMTQGAGSREQAIG